MNSESAGDNFETQEGAEVQGQSLSVGRIHSWSGQKGEDQLTSSQLAVTCLEFLRRLICFDQSLQL